MSKLVVKIVVIISLLLLFAVSINTVTPAKPAYACTVNYMYSYVEIPSGAAVSVSFTLNNSQSASWSVF